jgi:predicted transcriptional regulator
MPAAYFTDMWEDAGAEVTERIRDSDGPEWDTLAEHTVSEAMNRQVFSLAPDASVEECAEFMRTKGIHRVLVTDGDTLVGLVSTMDITGAVADHKLTVRVLTFGRPHHHGSGIRAEVEVP